uniref:Secreted protein n=1 Tax=Anopheles culicifacies TaxID=139723 RepID=A0A182M8N5_9DIPT
MATNGTVLRFRTLYVPAVLWLLGLCLLSHPTGATGATPARANKSTQDPSAYRSYHFVLLVKSNDSNQTNGTAGNVSEELVIMPTDADPLGQPTGGAFEVKPQPLPGHITSALVKQYHSSKASRKHSHPISPAGGAAKQLKNASTIISTAEPSILLHAGPRGTGKKQRFPKKVTPAMARTKQLKDKVTIHRLDASTKRQTNLRQLSLADVDLAPYELVATSKSLHHGQSRTVRKTSQKPGTADEQQPPPRYQVIGTFRDAHVPRDSQPPNRDALLRPGTIR